MGELSQRSQGCRDRGEEAVSRPRIGLSVYWFRTVPVAKNEAHICKLEKRKSVTRTGRELLFGKDGNF